MNDINTVMDEIEKKEKDGFELNPGDTGTVPECRCYTVEDLEAILIISKNSVYKLLKKKEFRWIRVGRSGYRIPRKSFDEWLEHTG